MSNENQRYERKFIVELPNMWHLSNYHIISTVSINQTFLKNVKDGDAHVRCEESNGRKTFYYSRKVCDRARGLRIIVEDQELNEEEYEELIKTRRNPKASVVSKTRFIFEYKEQIFNLDVLKQEVRNQQGETIISDKEGILMIEIPYPDEAIEYPRPMYIKEEITNDIGFTTKALAKMMAKY